MSRISIIFKVDIIGHPNYELHYCDEWKIQGKVWNIKRERYMKDITRKGYACTKLSENGKAIWGKMHRLLIQHFKPEEWDPSLVVNHKDHNRSNNNLNNLEMVSWSMNNSDQDKTNRSSRYQGVYYDKRRKRWICQVNQNKKRIFEKGFLTEKEAARARDNFIQENNLDLKLNDISDDE